jgi:hypothetical protein
VKSAESADKKVRIKFMKQKLTKVFPLVLAGVLQVMPLARQALPALASAGNSPAWAIVLKLAAGAVALLGTCHTVSGATTLSPASGTTFRGTVGVAFTTNITESGAPSTPHTWRVVGQTCPATGVGTPFAPGVTLPNPSSFNARVALAGTPTTAGTYTASIQVWENTGCGGGSFSASYTLIVDPPANVAPTLTVSPVNKLATVGTNVTLTATATGTPTPGYYW